MSRVRPDLHDDSGVSLILVLLFVTIVGLFVSTALTKSINTSNSVTQLRARASLQYTLDGGVDRAYQLLVGELESGSPASCTTTASTSTLSTFSLNSQTASLTCTTTSGRAASSSDSPTSDYALIVTSPGDDALTSSSGASSAIEIGGSVYLNGTVANSAVKEPLEITAGDLLSPITRPPCAADLAALTAISLTGSGQLKACTEQALQEAIPSVVLPRAPTADLAAALGSGLLYSYSINKNCQVFYPGLYTQAPKLGADNYFVSGLYYFAGIGDWQIDAGSNVIGGQRSVTADTAVPAGDCSGMDDATAMGIAGVAGLSSTIAPYRFSHGTTWVFGGSSSVNLVNGSVTLFTPPSGGSAFPVNLVGASSSTNGYTAMPLGSALLTGGSDSTLLQLNAKLYAPTTTVAIFSTNSTVATVRGGVVAYRVDLQAGVAGRSGLAISNSGGVGNPPPPFRTVKVVTADSSGTSNATNTSVATISNFSPYTVHVLSWRTGVRGD